MIAAIAPDFVEQNDPLSSRNPSTAMPGTAAAAEETSPGFSDARARIEEIEQLYTAGLSTYDIADALTLRPRDVGRNLREIRKRHQRAARRAEILAVGQCAAIQREAMDGWRRSQVPKQAVTIRRKSGEPDIVTTRTENRPGTGAFLNTALRAMKQLRQIAGEESAKPRKAGDATRLAMLEVLTPTQAAALTPDQVQQFRVALDRWSTLLNAVNDELHRSSKDARIFHRSRRPPNLRTIAARRDLRRPSPQRTPNSSTIANDLRVAFRTASVVSPTPS